MRLITVISLMIMSFFYSYSVENDIDTEKTQVFMFANQLFKNGEYYQAAGEYQRFSYLYPNDIRSETSDFMQVYCYYHGEQFSKCNNLLQSFLTRYPDTKFKSLIILLTIGCMTHNNWDNIDFNMLLNNFDKKTDVYHFILYLQGWQLLENGKWILSSQKMQQVTELNNIDECQQAANKIIIFLSKKTPEIKSPEKARQLSAWLPGAGQWSLGNHVDGIESFLVTSGVTYTSYQWFTTDFTIGAIFMLYQGTFRFYKGSQYNAAEQAKTANNKIIKGVIIPVFDKYNPWIILNSYLMNKIMQQEKNK